MTIFQQRKEHAFWLVQMHHLPLEILHLAPSTTVCSVVQHLSTKSPFGEAPSDSSSIPQHPTPFWGSSCFRAPGLVWLLTAQVWCEAQELCFLPEDFCSACFSPVLIAKQREAIGWLNIHSFIRCWWQLLPPSPVIFTGRTGTLCRMVKGTVGGDWFVRL